MTQTLIVSDNEILNQLYVTNMEVYLGTRVTLVHSINEAVAHLRQKPVDLVVSMSMIDGQDSASVLFDYIHKEKLKAELVVIGNPARELSDVIVVPSSYHLQNLLRSCAKILGVTAKQMAEMEVPDYYPVQIKFLMRVREIPCSLYLSVKSKDAIQQYTMIAKKGDIVRDIMTKLANEHVDKLYVVSFDRLLIINAISTVVCDYIKGTDGLSVNQKSEAIKEGLAFAADSFSQLPAASQEIMNIAQSCTKVMDEIVQETPSLRKLIGLLNSKKDGFIYTHSMLSAYVCNHIIRKVAWGGESHIEKINFVLFFHDIILAPLYLKYPDLRYEEDLLFSEILNDKEKELVLNHARLAAEAVMGFKRVPIGADLLIKQHHGMTSGIGFAPDFKDDISPLSKVVLISESFMEEFFRGRDENEKYQLDIKKIQAILYEKFKRNTYKKIIETLDTLAL